jgi:hypothetical protein
LLVTDDWSTEFKVAWRLLGVFFFLTILTVVVFPSYTATDPAPAGETHIETVEARSYFPLAQAVIIEFDSEATQYSRITIETTGESVHFYPKAAEWDGQIQAPLDAGVVTVRYYNSSGVVRYDQFEVQEERLL